MLGLVLAVALLGAAPRAASADADLSISTTASPEPVLVNDPLTYTITVKNNGPADATTVQLADTLPAGVTFESATPLQGTCSEATGTVTCSLDPLPNAQSATVQITVRPQSADTITNQASVSSTDPDPNPADNSASTQTTVSPVADLAITATAVPDPVVAGEFLTYTLVVENRGPSEAAAVSVTDTLPTDVAFAEASNSCLEFNGTVTCKVGALASGQSATLNMTVRPQSAGSIVNEARVSSSVMDPVAANDTATVQTTVSSSPLPPAAGTSAPVQPSTSLNVVLTGSYVLISGRSVKLVNGRFVPVNLTCAGPRRCDGAITVSTVRRVKSTRKGKRQKLRVARLGSKGFSIDGNRQQKVLVPLSKSKVKLLRRLKQVKAKAAIREIDLKGNPRISTRTFTLRAR
jgi:uncharacterized repeat protein (TIGR01451 family)